MLCMLFTGVGVALGLFLSSVCSAFFAISEPSCKNASAARKKASSASFLFNTREGQFGVSTHPMDSIGKLNQTKSTLDSRDNELNVSQHQRSVSQLLSDDITKLDHGRKALDACESHSAWHPSTETDDHDGHCLQSSELDSPSSNAAKAFTLSNVNLKPDPFDRSKRHGYLSWDDYFMAIAFLSAHRSKDPNRQVGACLVSQDRVILGIGYNGFPRGCSDDELPWAKMSKNGDPLQTKYPYVCHAEVNAILNKNHASACGQRLYVTMFPCNECAKIIIQAGVAEVVYFIGKHSSLDCSYVASQKLLSMAGVKVWQHQPAQRTVVLDFK